MPRYGREGWQSGFIERPMSDYFQATAASTVPTVKVYVGPERKLFIFPEAFLCDRIKFFKSAFQSGFRESTAKSIDLPEDDPVAFSFIIDHTLGNGSEMSDKVLPENIQLALCKAYVLADKLGCLDAVQETVDRDLEVHRCWEYEEDFESRLVCPGASRFVYENTPESAPIRQTIVNAATDLYHSPTCFSAERMKMWLESATSHPKFHVDIMVSIRKESMPGKKE